MPSKAEILSGLYALANDYWGVAMLWHVILLILMLLFLRNWRPSNRLMAILSSFPLFSVSLFAWISGNPFNGALFIVFAGLLMIWGLRLDHNPVSPGSSWFSAIGIMVFFFGLVYPHFLETSSYFTYLYAAPVGLIPCATLSTVIGVAIIFNGYLSFRWSLGLLLMGLFYGFVGVFRLGVMIDLVLIAGALVLLLEILMEQKSRSISKTIKTDQQ